MNRQIEISGKRKAAKVSQAALRKALGLNFGTVTDIENSRIEVSDSTLASILAAIDALAAPKDAMTTH